MKIVVDTNILVAAYFKPHSFSAKILQLAEKGVAQIYWSLPLYREAKKILDFLPQKDRERILTQVFKPRFKISSLPKVEIVSEDPEDNKVLACASGGQVDMIISNDKHLLQIEEFEGIKIVSSKEACKLITPSQK